MYETQITVQGWVGTEVTVKDAGGASLASFRLASTPRRYNRSTSSWVDLPTSWFTINAWRTLGMHCAESLSVGQAVVVQGRLTAQVWTDQSGDEHITHAVEALSVGHDLNRGTSSFRKSEGSGEGIDSQAVAEHNAQFGIGGPQVNSNGETIDEMVVKAEAEAPAA